MRVRSYTCLLPQLPCEQPSHRRVCAGYSVQNNSIVVDLSRYFGNYTSLGGGLAEIGAGIRLGPLYYAAWQDDEQAFPAGTCPAVGAGGHLLGVPCQIPAQLPVLAVGRCRRSLHLLTACACHASSP